MALLPLAALIFTLGSTQGQSAPEDRWVSGASPFRMITDPCEPAVQGEEGVSLSWVRLIMLDRGHPLDLVCEVYTDEDSTAEVPDAAKANLQDLAAQVAGRSLVFIGSMSRPLDDDGSWGPKSDAGSRALYLHLKADDYRALRELRSQGTIPAPPPE